jgi:cellulose synthase/poly-beta-1,6-N-acetylglucosamine synthase-like glycosyltransferase
MLTILSLAMMAFALFLLIPTLAFVVEISAACLPIGRDNEKIVDPRDRRLAVLIPAHNEGVGITPTIGDITQQLRPGDRLVLVADNCSDDTAAIATSLGVEVSTRNDLTRIGKGYALAWGIKYLATAPPDIVIVIDADCRVSAGALEILSGECSASGRPIQGLYLMFSAAGSTVNQQVAQFAWRVKNLVRPLGLRNLHLPCQLTGSGMAFPWSILQSANLSSGFIAEDMKLGLELAAQGRAPLYCPSAIVTSTFPTSDKSTREQRKRWEQGHMSLILGETPMLLAAAIRQRDSKLFAAVLDLSIPPLSILVSVLAAATIGTGLAVFMGLSAVPFFLTAAGLLLVAAATLVAWIKHGRDVLPMRDLILIVPYLVKKLGLYADLAVGRRASRWIRTDRS